MVSCWDCVPWLRLSPTSRADGETQWAALKRNSGKLYITKSVAFGERVLIRGDSRLLRTQESVRDIYELEDEKRAQALEDEQQLLNEIRGENLSARVDATDPEATRIGRPRARSRSDSCGDVAMYHDVCTDPEVADRSLCQTDVMREDDTSEPMRGRCRSDSVVDFACDASIERHDVLLQDRMLGAGEVRVPTSSVDSLNSELEAREALADKVYQLQTRYANVWKLSSSVREKLKGRADGVGTFDCEWLCAEMTRFANWRRRLYRFQNSESHVEVLALSEKENMDEVSICAVDKHAVGTRIILLPPVRMRMLSSKSMIDCRESVHQYGIAAALPDTVDADASLPTVLFPFAIAWQQNGEECRLVSATASNESRNAWVDCLHAHMNAATMEQSSLTYTESRLPVCGGSRLGYGGLDLDSLCAEDSKC